MHRPAITPRAMLLGGIVIAASSCSEDLAIPSATYGCRTSADCLLGYECIATPALGEATCIAAATDMIRIAASDFDFWPASVQPLIDECGEPTAAIPARASLSYAFDIDRAEVTVGRFAAWVDAGMPVPCSVARCSLDPGGPLDEGLTWEASWNTLAQDTTTFDPGTFCVTDSPVDYGDPTYKRGEDALPMTCVSWYQAVAFCAWDGGKRLPTDTEWQLAATGGQGRVAPFEWSGEALTCRDLTFDGEPGHCSFPLPVASAEGDLSRDGLTDMTGSVFEWTWDLHADYPPSTQDYTGLAGGSEDRVRRGCSFICDTCFSLFTNFRREAYHPTKFYNDAGFRCARSVK